MMRVEDQGHAAHRALVSGAPTISSALRVLSIALAP